MSAVLDASALIALLDADDTHHVAALDVLEKLAGEALLMHPLTVAECFVGPVSVGREQQLVEALDRLRIVVDLGDDASPLRLARVRAETGLRMPDCCPIEVADRRGSVLITFDARQHECAVRLGVEVAPPVLS